MTAQQKLVRHRSIKRYVIFGMVVVCIIMALLGLYYFHVKSQYIASQRKLSQIQTESQNVVTDVQAPKYVVDSTGRMDPIAEKTIQHITREFNMITTYHSATDYNNNRAKAHDYIKDPNFYKTFLTPEVNQFGKSIIAQRELQSIPNYVHVYEINPGQYLVTLSYYMYHHSDELSQKQGMDDTQAVLLLSGDDLRISHATYLKNISSQQYNE